MRKDIEWLTGDWDERERLRYMALGERWKDFGPWRYVERNNVLQLHDRKTANQYEIDLDSCDTSPQVLDWICQIASKRWATDAILSHLVRAFNILLQPQANLCSFGFECKQIKNTKKLILQLHQERLKKWTPASTKGEPRDETPTDPR